mmetsp:Transcript_4256/g.12014  ORF Transcript_4256/g.12014 Transcript_4256/m.12014 type:complete len:187 (+) Transcript_4256:249-809(+)
MCKLADAAAKTSNDKKWVKSNRPEGSLYRGDSLDKLPRIAKGGKTEEKLAAEGMQVVGDFANLTEEEVANKANAMQGISPHQMTLWRALAIAATDGNPPKDTDYRDKESNGGYSSPYEALGRARGYGDNWRDFLWKESPYHKGFMCIKKLVTHIMKETEKMFIGTTHEKDFLLYHDAPSLCHGTIV